MAIAQQHHHQQHSVLMVLLILWGFYSFECCNIAIKWTVLLPTHDFFKDHTVLKPISRLSVVPTTCIAAMRGQCVT